MQYESEIENAIVNLRTAKIQLLQMLNDRTPVDQFDVTAHSISATSCSHWTLTAMRRWRRVPTCRRRCRPFSNPTLTTNWRSRTALPIRPYAGWFTNNSSTNNPNGPETIGVSVSIPLRIFDRNQGEKKRTLIDIDRSQQASEATRAQVFSDVDTAYELVRSNIALLKPYKEKYNDQALRVRDTVTFAYEHGGASLDGLPQCAKRLSPGATRLCTVTRILSNGGGSTHSRRRLRTASVEMFEQRCCVRSTLLLKSAI